MEAASSGSVLVFSTAYNYPWSGVSQLSHVDFAHFGKAKYGWHRPLHSSQSQNSWIRKLNNDKTFFKLHCASEEQRFHRVHVPTAP